MTAVTVIAAMDSDNNWAHCVFPVDEKALKPQLEAIFKGAGVSAAIASGLARGLSVYDAVVLAKEFVNQNFEGRLRVSRPAI
jgi:pyridoxine kinase